MQAMLRAIRGAFAYKESGRRFIIVPIAQAEALIEAIEADGLRWQQTDFKSRQFVEVEVLQGESSR